MEIQQVLKFLDGFKPGDWTLTSTSGWGRFEKRCYEIIVGKHESLLTTVKRGSYEFQLTYMEWWTETEYPESDPWFTPQRRQRYSIEVIDGDTGARVFYYEGDDLEDLYWKIRSAHERKDKSERQGLLDDFERYIDDLT
ncbi:MAG: hypothetical protein AB1646_07665 [Thermodesulfobacteriota bacterium]